MNAASASEDVMVQKGPRSVSCELHIGDADDIAVLSSIEAAYLHPDILDIMRAFRFDLNKGPVCLWDLYI